MRLSEIKGEKVLDVAADLIEPLCNIAETEEVKKLFTREAVQDKKAAQEIVLKKLRSYAPAMIRSCKKDIIAVLAILDDKTPAEYEAEMTAFTLMRDLTTFLNDPVLMSLFLSAQRAGENSSGAAPETTTAAKE